MTGYSWFSIIALFCYVFLFVTFLSMKKSSKVIHAFMSLLVIMILWAGGSFAMRIQLWPSVILWHHVSVLGMTMLVAGYYNFTLAFLEEKNARSRYFWAIFHFLLFVFNYFTGLFIPDPLVVESNGSVQFIYNYTWHIYILLACILPCLFRMIHVIYRHCKGNHIAFQQLRPIINGLLILVIGHVAATLPFFSGVPLDIMSGPINVLFMFYALYNKRLFKMTVLFTKANYFLFALVIGFITGNRFVIPLQHFLTDAFSMNQAVSLLAVAVILILYILLLYTGITLLFNYFFIRNEKIQQAKIDQFAEVNSHMLNVQDILQNLTDIIQDLTHIERILIFTQLTDGDFRVEHTTNPLEEKNFYLKSDHPLVTYFASHNNPVSHHEFSRTTVYRSMWEKEKKDLHVLNADYFIPLICEKGLVGILVLPCNKDNIPYPLSSIQQIHTVCSLSATPIYEATAYERAIDDARKDKLTGLANRKYFFEFLESEFKKYQESALALCIINIDDFKRYNQLYGAQEGDLALQRVAGILISNLNESSTAARIGGKEFAVILPGYDIHSAKMLAENLASEIGKISDHHREQIPKPLTVSAGICAAPYMASSAKELFQNAETAVYTVKRSGKNAVQIYSSEIYPQEAQQFKYASGYSENASTIQALTAAIATKDPYTYQHSENVAYYAVELAKSTGMENDLVEIVKEASLLHDIGKICIREDILNKPSKLTPAEFEIMKGHVESAVNIIHHLPSLEYVIPTVASHHEHYDGSGYPNHLKGEDIPIMGRILCIADAFDAITSERSYHKPLGKEEAIALMQSEAGKQFDPKLVLIFLEMVKNNSVEIRGASTAAQTKAEPDPASFPVQPAETSV